MSVIYARIGPCDEEDQASAIERLAVRVGQGQLAKHHEKIRFGAYCGLGGDVKMEKADAH